MQIGPVAAIAASTALTAGGFLTLMSDREGSSRGFDTKRFIGGGGAFVGGFGLFGLTAGNLMWSTGAKPGHPGGIALGAAIGLAGGLYGAQLVAKHMFGTSLFDQ